MVLKAATLALAVSAASPAAAQAVGTYTGALADGTNFSVTVSTDPNNGSNEITAMSLSLQGACKPSGSINTGWGLGFNQDFSGTKVTVTDSFDYLFTTANLVFHADNTVTGTITSYTPTFASFSGAHPTKSVFCTVPKQALSATLSDGSVAAPRPRAFIY